MVSSMQERIAFLAQAESSAPASLGTPPSSPGAPLQILPPPQGEGASIAPPASHFDANQVAALLDKRDPAMTALKEIDPATANSDSKQLISALNVTRASPMTDLLVNISSCAGTAASRGSRSAVNILQNECSREYLDWFPTCTQPTKACATEALFMSRMGIEAYEKCLGEFDQTACNPTDPDSYFVRGPAARPGKSAVPKDSEITATSDHAGGQTIVIVIAVIGLGIAFVGITNIPKVLHLFTRRGTVPVGFVLFIQRANY